MGVGYKGGSSSHRGIGENAGKLKQDPKYHFDDGYFGPKHKGSLNAHDLYFDDPVAASKAFYDKIAYGGIETQIGENHWLTLMKDGTWIDYRVTTSSDGSPAVLINVKESTDSGGVRYHKIHFSKPKNGKKEK